MTRCPDTYRPAQHSGRARYRFAGRVMRCVLEEGHEGAHVHEPDADLGKAIDYILSLKEPGAIGTSNVPAPIMPRTPEQIAESDARYREHLRRKRRG